MSWQFNRTEAVFIQIGKRLRMDIFNGKYPPDSQFPSVRQLASEAAVNPNTMQKALSLLEEEGILYSKGTIGRFVTSDAAVLKKGRTAIRRELIRGLLLEARELGISNDELVEYIETEGKKNV